jgi:UDP-apiose/xylose synthase
MAPKTVCIVGVAGFIGSHMLEKIIREKDWNVIGVDMVAPTKIQQLLGAEKKWASRFEFHQVQAAAARVRSRVLPGLPGILPPRH